MSSDAIGSADSGEHERCSMPRSTLSSNSLRLMATTSLSAASNAVEGRVRLVARRVPMQSSTAAACRPPRSRARIFPSIAS